MPTKRQRRPQARRLFDLPGDLVDYLTLGQYGGNGGGSFDVFQLAGSVLHGNYVRLRHLWSDHGAAILDEWIDDHPGSRPFAWWVCIAPAPRRVLCGAEWTLAGANPAHFAGNEIWRQHFGVPVFLPCRPRDCADLPRVESQATYLDRHQLLEVEERAALEDDAFEDQEINPFIVDTTTAERSE